MSKPIRVVLITKGRVFAEAFGSLLNRQPGFKFVDFGCSFDAPSQPRLSELADVVLVEVSVHGASTTRWIQRLRDEAPNAHIIILGLENRQDDVLKFIEAGAIGYISKEESFVDLVELIEAVCHGQTACSSALAVSVFGRISELSHGALPTKTTRIELTGREKEVLRLLAARLSNKEIAGRLGITPNTVKNHVHHILRKFGVSYRRELIQELSNSEWSCELAMLQNYPKKELVTPNVPSSRFLSN